MAERIVHTFEAVDVDEEQREKARGIAARELGAGRDSLQHQRAIRQAREAIVLSGVLDLARALAHELLELFALARCVALRTPLGAERERELLDLDRLEGLFEHEQAVGVTERRAHFVEGLIRVRGAEHDLDPRVALPERANRLQTVPARRHSHVDESDLIGLPRFDRAPGEAHTRFALARRLQLESGREPPRLLVPEERELRGAA
jgi:hypothetical protein